MHQANMCMQRVKGDSPAVHSSDNAVLDRMASGSPCSTAHARRLSVIITPSDLCNPRQCASGLIIAISFDAAVDVVDSPQLLETTQI